MAIQNTTNIPEVKDTIVMLRELSADEKVRQEAYYREKDFMTKLLLWVMRDEKVMQKASLKVLLKVKR